MRHISLLFLLTLTQLLSAQTEVGPLSVGQYGIDETAALVLCRADLPALNAATNDLFTRVRAQKTYAFTQGVAELEYGIPYTVTEGDRSYTLYFTQLPLLAIEAEEDIPDDPKVPATFHYGDDEQTTDGHLGIELRGGFSQTYPKKTYDLEFWEDATGDDSRDVQFGDLRNDDDWILDALYNEPLRINAFLAHKLWLDWHEPYYQAEDDRARAGAGVKWCELFVNDRYQGLYLLSEQVDRKLLRIKKYKEDDNEIRGELYKSVQWSAPTKFEGLLSTFDNTETSLDEYELEYPDPDDVIDWSNLADLLEFTVNAANEDFAAGVSERFVINNIADYFLYLNLLAAEDNSGKNIYTARYDADEPYFFVPWDLDGTFGNRWDGTNFPWTRSILTNGLYRRMTEGNVNGFNDALCARYSALTTEGLLAADSLRVRVERAYDYLTENGVYAREADRWPEDFLDFSPAKLQYTLDWIDERTAFLSDWVCNIPTSTDGTDPVVDLRVWPNPSDGHLLFNRPPNQEVAWQLFDVAGRRLAEGNILQGQGELRLPEVAGGMYFLRLGERSHRLVVR